MFQYKSQDRNQLFNIDKLNIISVEDAIKFLNIIEKKMPQVKAMLQAAGGRVVLLENQLNRPASPTLGYKSLEEMKQEAPVQNIEIPQSQTDEEKVDNQAVVDTRLAQMKEAKEAGATTAPEVETAPEAEAAPAKPKTTAKKLQKK